MDKSTLTNQYTSRLLTPTKKIDHNEFAKYLVGKLSIASVDGNVFMYNFDWSDWIWRLLTKHQFEWIIMKELELVLWEEVSAFTNADKNKNTFRNEEQRQDVATVGNTTTTTVETTTTTTTISTEPTCPMPVEPTCPIPAEPSCPMPESVSTTAAVVTHEDCISKQIPNVKILDIATKNEFYLHDIIYNYKISILGMYSCKF